MTANEPTPAERAEDERRALENTVRAGRATILALVAHLRAAPPPRPGALKSGTYGTWWEATQSMTAGYDEEPARVSYHLPVRFDETARHFGNEPRQVSSHEFTRLCGHEPTWPWPGQGGTRDWGNEPSPDLVVPKQGKQADSSN